MKNSTAKAIAAIAISVAISIAIWVTKNPNPLWALLIIPMFWGLDNKN